MAQLNYQKMTIGDIKEWCKANNQVEWLKDYALTPNADGKKPTFFSIKKAFCKKFMPEIMPKKKKGSMYDDIANM